MNETQRMEELQRLFLTAPASLNTRVVAIAASLTLVAAVLWLVRRRRLDGEFTPIWLAVALGAAALGLSPTLLHGLARLIGAWTPSSTLFFFGQFFLVFTCLHYAVRLSRLSLQVKNLAQELALLRAGAPAEAADGGDG